jgi:microcystin-dependent protein
MSSPFVAEIRIFGCNFAPTGWAQCNGQILPISQNTALFSLLGTFYGGDGKTTFALPNLEGSAPIHVGGNQPGKGLSDYFIGQIGGTEAITLLQSEIPLHSHFIRAHSVDFADSQNPSVNSSLGKSAQGSAFQSNSSANLTQMAFQALPPAGGDLPHNNMMPYLVLNYCIALQGVFPPRT